MVWGRIKLVFNFTRVVKVSQNFQALKTQVKLNNNFARIHVIH